MKDNNIPVTVVGSRGRVTEKSLTEKLNNLVKDHILLKVTNKYFSIVEVLGKNNNIYNYKKSGTLRELDYFLRGIEEYNYFMKINL